MKKNKDIYCSILFLAANMKLILPFRRSHTVSGNGEVKKIATSEPLVFSNRARDTDRLKGYNRKERHLFFLQSKFIK